jgi:hypothetical protein
LGRFGQVVRNPPQHAAGIEQREVAHGPGPIGGLADSHAELRRKGARPCIPGVGVAHQQVHLETGAEGRLVVVLQQEAGAAVTNVSQVLVVPRNLEAERPIEALREREVAGGHERLDLERLQRVHQSVLRCPIWRRIQSCR